MRYRLTCARPPKSSENDVEAALKDWLLTHNWYPVRLQSGLMRTPDHRFLRLGTPGLPDYVILHERQPAFFLETKRPGGVLSPAQVRTRWALAHGYGLPVCVADSLEKLTEWMKANGRRTD